MLKKITFILFCLFYSASHAEPILLDAMVANVNNELITLSQLNAQIELTKQQLSAQHIALPPHAVLQKQVLERMISQALQLQIAKRAHITVTDSNIDEAIAQMAKMQNILSEQLIHAVSKEGIPLATFRKQLANQLIIGQLQRALISPTINVLPAEIDAYIRSFKKQSNDMQYHVEDILITLPSAPSPDEIKAAIQSANGLIAKIKAGSDFKTIAASVSQGQEALQGGDLGWHSLAELPSTFSKAIQNLQIGELSPPLRAADGIHILSLLGVRAGSVNNLDFDSSRQEIANKLFKRKFEERLSIWLKQAHDSAYIKNFLEDENTQNSNLSN